MLSAKSVIRTIGGGKEVDVVADGTPTEIAMEVYKAAREMRNREHNTAITKELMLIDIAFSLSILGYDTRLIEGEYVETSIGRIVVE